MRKIHGAEGKQQRAPIEPIARTMDWTALLIEFKTFNRRWHSWPLVRFVPSVDAPLFSQIFIFATFSLLRFHPNNAPHCFMFCASILLTIPWECFEGKEQRTFIISESRLFQSLYGEKHTSSLFLSIWFLISLKNDTLLLHC